MDYLRAIELLDSDNEAEAGLAMESLDGLIKINAKKYLHRRIFNPDTRDDIVSEAMVRIFSRRRTTKFSSVPAFVSYVRLATHSALVEYFKHHEVPLEDGFEPTAGEPDVCDPEALSKFEEIADIIWLGADPEMSPLQRKRRLLAAKLVLLDERSIAEVEDLLRIRWETCATHSPTLAAFAFSVLYASRDRVAAHVIDPKMPATEAHLDEVVRAAWRKDVPCPYPDREWEEIQILALRFRNGLNHTTIDQVLSKVSPKRIESVIAQAVASLPFAKIASRLAMIFALHELGPCPTSNKDLLRRLVYQYGRFDNLPQIHVFERTKPVADHGQLTFNPELLNTWLSGRRLDDQMKKYILKENGNVEL